MRMNDERLNSEYNWKDYKIMWRMQKKAQEQER